MMTTAVADRSRELTEYVHDAHVRARVREYCGATPGTAPTARYVALLRGDEQPHVIWRRARQLPPTAIEEAMALGDVSRSLWDHESLVVLLDLDYENIDQAWEPFTHPADVFLKLEPTYVAVLSELATWGLPVQACMTGRGYHFVGRIPLDAPLVERLAKLLPAPPPWFLPRRALVPDLTERTARAWAGLGLLMEHLAHGILRRAERRSPIPVVLNGTIVGRGTAGRECVSIDISHVGDPLDVRHMRMPFTTYRWHQFRPDIFGPGAGGDAVLVVVPRAGEPFMDVLTRGRGLDAAREVAGTSDGTLPDMTAGMTRVLEDYETTPLATFHRAFYGAAPDEADVPAFLPQALPPCVTEALRQPNDLLLRPEYLQHLTRGLIARGWTARQVATLVTMAYRDDHAWGDHWVFMDPASRAEFDVRVFAGLLATGADRLVDFNCVSAQEKGLCPRTGCERDLRVERDRLLGLMAGGVT